MTTHPFPLCAATADSPFIYYPSGYIGERPGWSKRLCPCQPPSLCALVVGEYRRWEPKRWRRSRMIADH